MARHTLLSVAAAVADGAALLAMLATAGVAACAAPGRPLAAASAACHRLGLPPLAPGAAVGLACVVALGLVPSLTLRWGRRWPCALAVAGQLLVQLLGLGLFLLWVPALLLTAAAALI